MNRPLSAFSTLTNSNFDGSEQFCYGFKVNFGSLALNSSHQFVKGLCFPSAIVYSLFLGQLSSIWWGKRRPLQADSSPMEWIRCNCLAAPVTHPDSSTERQNQARNSKGRHCEVAGCRKWRWCAEFLCSEKRAFAYSRAYSQMWAHVSKNTEG